MDTLVHQHGKLIHYSWSQCKH